MPTVTSRASRARKSRKSSVNATLLRSGGDEIQGAAETLQLVAEPPAEDRRRKRRAAGRLLDSRAAETGQVPAGRLERPLLGSMGLPYRFALGCGLLDDEDQRTPADKTRAR
ncbi:MAG TPA: hypothetical protein VJV23_16775 [Candidatus Polarisedimenticolia bacterium]|nr:hypothetical protein [Candidatus Polarisedimenticolia bacterium]